MPEMIHEDHEQLLTVSHLGKMAHECAKIKGWWDGEKTRNVGEVLANIHAEVTEAWEEWRDGHDLRTVRYRGDGKPEGFPVELADIMIRVMDFAENLGVDMEAVIREKVSYNRTRPYRHGGKRA